MHLKLSRMRHRDNIRNTWEKVWPNVERGPNGLYLLYGTNGLCPQLELIKGRTLSIILWCN